MSKKNKNKQKIMNQNETGSAQVGTNPKPKRQLIPTPEWQSDDVLEMRGDVAEAIETSFYELVQHTEAVLDKVQLISSAWQQFVAVNLKSGKMKIKLFATDGSEVTEEEERTFHESLKTLQAEAKEKLNNTSIIVAPNGEKLESTLNNVPEEKLSEASTESVDVTDNVGAKVIEGNFQ